VARLKLPPDQDAERALEELWPIARRGACAAAWLRVRYLIDLFDVARLFPVERGALAPSHALLWRALRLAGDPGRGRIATVQVIEGLNTAVAVLPRSCPEQVEAETARRLLQADAAARRDIASALATAVTYKQIARSESALAPNAALRLLDWCAQAFRLAAGGSTALQAERLNQCLFPLFDADPRPYFSPNPAERPPDPPWPVLARILAEKRSRLSQTRLAFLAHEIVQSEQTFLSLAAPTLPTPLDLSRITLPSGVASEAWDRTPLVLLTGQGFLVGGQAILADDLEALESAISRRLRGDRRGRVAVAAASGTDARTLLAVARAARRAGARILELGVARRVADRAPSGDVQSAVAPGQPVRRLEVIPVSLVLLSSAAAGAPSRDGPRGLDYDVRTGEHELTLSVGRGHFSVASADGILPSVPKEGLTSWLDSLRRAYPDDTSLILVPGPTATYSDAVDAAGLALSRGSDRSPFAGLALAGPGRVPGNDADLRPLLQLFGAARVSTDPTLPPPWLSALRRCYLETLRLSAKDSQAAAPEGTLVLLGDRGRTRVVGGTLRDRKLRLCTLEAASTPPLPVGRVTATFSLRAAPLKHAPLKPLPPNAHR
jgi:hypothetical protein